MARRRDRGAAATAAVRTALERRFRAGDQCGHCPRAATGRPGSRNRSSLSASLLPGLRRPTLVSAGIAAVVAEQWCGAARGLANVVALSAGEHVTSGIILDGEPWPGAHGLAGSVGWLSLNPVEREDYRRLGGLEAEVVGRWHRAAHRLAHQVGRRIDHRAAASGRPLAHHGRPGVSVGAHR